MSTRKSVRYKLPVNVFIDGHHCPVIDFSRTGAGLIKNEFEPLQKKYILFRNN